MDSSNAIRLLIQRDAIMVFKTNRRSERLPADFYDFFITLNKKLIFIYRCKFLNTYKKFV